MTNSYDFLNNRFEDDSVSFFNIETFMIKKFEWNSIGEKLLSKEFDCLTEIQESFSLVYFHNNVLYLIRDPFGNIPLFYRFFENKVYFSTEIKTLITNGNFKREINESEIINYFGSSNSQNYSENTFWKGVFSVLPGQVLEIGSKFQKKYTNYFTLIPKTNYQNPFIDFKNILTKSIDNKLLFTHGVSTTLSGGLDSSSLTCLIQSLFEKKINSLELRSKFEINDETKYAKSVVDLWQTNHSIIDLDKIDKNFLAAEYKMCSLTGLPSQPYSIAVRDFEILNHLKKNNSKYLVMGHGGDDVLITRSHILEELIRNEEWEKLKISFLDLTNLFKNDLFLKTQYNEKYIISTSKKFISEKKFRKFIMFFFYATNLKLKISSIIELIQIIFKKLFKFEGRSKYLKNIFKLKNINIKIESLNHFDLISKGFNEAEKNYLIEIFRPSAFKNHEQSYLFSKQFGINYVYPFYDLDLMSFMINAPLGISWGKGLGRNVIREALSEIIPEIVKKRFNKTDFSNYHLILFTNIYPEINEKFTSNHLIWKYIDKEMFIKIGNKLMQSVKKKINSKSTYNTVDLRLMLKIIFLGIWLDIFFQNKL